jgi:type IV secretion system protein VirB10
MPSAPAHTRTQGASRKLVATVLWSVGIICALVLAARYFAGATVQDARKVAAAQKEKEDLATSSHITPAALATKAEQQSNEAQRHQEQAKQEASIAAANAAKGGAPGMRGAGAVPPGKGTEPLRMPSGTPDGSPGLRTEEMVADETKALNMKNQARASKMVAFEDSAQNLGGVDTLDSASGQPLSMTALNSQLQQARTPSPTPDFSGLLKAAQGAQTASLSSSVKPASASALGTNATPNQRNQDWLAQQETQGPDQAPLTPTPAPSEYLLAEGTPIPIVLLGDVNSDLPGRLSAMTTRDIYDSISQRYLLIPAGARLTGVYNAEVAPGQKRILMAFSRMRFSTGASIRLGGMPAADANGASGAEAQVDSHFFEMFGASLIIGAVSLAAAPANTSSTNVTINLSGSGNGNSAMASLGTQVLGDTLKRVLDRNTNIKTTLSLTKGERLTIITTRDMVLPPSVTGGSRVY